MSMGSFQTWVRHARAALLLLAALAVAAPSDSAAWPGKKQGKPVVVAQISDTHLGLLRSSKTNQPIDTPGQLARGGKLANQRHPDAVIVSGDIGETPRPWQQARERAAKA